MLKRLDQALGIKADPLPALIEPPALFVQRAFPDPLISSAGLEAETERLAIELCASLDARGLGARRVHLSLYRADGTVAEARAGMSFPCRTPEHLLALLKEKLEALDAGLWRRHPRAGGRAGGTPRHPAGGAAAPGLRAPCVPIQPFSSTASQTTWALRA